MGYSPVHLDYKNRKKIYLLWIHTKSNAGKRFAISYTLSFCHAECSIFHVTMTTWSFELNKVIRKRVIIKTLCRHSNSGFTDDISSLQQIYLTNYDLS